MPRRWYPDCRACCHLERPRRRARHGDVRTCDMYRQGVITLWTMVSGIRHELGRSEQCHPVSSSVSVRNGQVKVLEDLV